MISPYRRDVIAHSLFRFSEITLGASFVSVWFSKLLSIPNKLAVGALIVLFFGLAVLAIPNKPVGKER